jgi:predicted RNA-binding Zn ribbon-like protein
VTADHVESPFGQDPFGGWAVENGVPAKLALVYDFANTLDERTFGSHAPGDRRDLIDQPDALRGWLAARGFPVLALTHDDLGRARELRAALRAAIASNLEPDVRASARAAIGSVASRLPLLVGMDEDGRPTLQPARSGLEGALASILAQVMSAAADDAWARLKMCSALDCRWVFYDASKPRTGRWCAMAPCGNRAKTRAYRERRAGLPPSGGAGAHPEPALG